jgi:hypothetical protein
MTSRDRDNQATGSSENVGITRAWTLLAGCDAAHCYVGCNSDGLHEIALCDPCTRLPIAVGRGLTIEQAICAGVREIEQKKGGQL